jgi:hypothetical protein
LLAQHQHMPVQQQHDLIQQQHLWGTRALHTFSSNDLPHARQCQHQSEQRWVTTQSGDAVKSSRLSAQLSERESLQQLDELLQVCVEGRVCKVRTLFVVVTMRAGLLLRYLYRQQLSKRGGQAAAGRGLTGVWLFFGRGGHPRFHGQHVASACCEESSVSVALPLIAS